jgi:iron complex transport system substrate-binding protein
MKTNEVIALVVAFALIVGGGFYAVYSLSEEADDDDVGDIIILDHRGENVTFTTVPDRIISLGSSFTEVIYLIGAEDQLVGVDKYSDYPADALNKTNVGSGYTINQEAVLALDPDCILAWDYIPYSEAFTTAIENFEALGIPVILFYPGTVDEIMTTIMDIGKVCGMDDEAEDIVDDMQDRIDDIEDAVADIDEEDRVKVYYENRKQQSTSAGTLTNDLITMAGGDNIALVNTTTKYPQLSWEYIIDENPAVIVIEDESEITNEQLMDREGWSSITAVQNEDVYRLSGDWTSVTPRVVDALEQFAAWFYPELFA